MYCLKFLASFSFIRTVRWHFFNFCYMKNRKFENFHIVFKYTYRTISKTRSLNIYKYRTYNRNLRVVNYILLFDKPVSIYEFENEFEYVVVKLMSERLCCLYYFHKKFVVLEDLLQRNSRFSYY